MRYRFAVSPPSHVCITKRHAHVASTVRLCGQQLCCFTLQPFMNLDRTTSLGSNIRQQLGVPLCTTWPERNLAKTHKNTVGAPYTTPHPSTNLLLIGFHPSFTLREIYYTLGGRKEQKTRALSKNVMIQLLQHALRKATVQTKLQEIPCTDELWIRIILGRQGKVQGARKQSDLVHFTQT